MLKGYVREELFSDGEPKRVIPQNRFPGETVSTPIEIPALFAYFQKCRDFKAMKTCKIAGFF